MTKKHPSVTVKDWFRLVDEKEPKPDEIGEAYIEITKTFYMA